MRKWPLVLLVLGLGACAQPYYPVQTVSYRPYQTPLSRYNWYSPVPVPPQSMIDQWRAMHSGVTPASADVPTPAPEKPPPPSPDKSDCYGWWSACQF